jgi:hypothetical protein
MQTRCTSLKHGAQGRGQILVGILGHHLLRPARGNIVEGTEDQGQRPAVFARQLRARGSLRHRLIYRGRDRDFFQQIGNRITPVLSAHHGRVTDEVDGIADPSLFRQIRSPGSQNEAARPAVAPPSLPHVVTGRRFSFSRRPQPKPDPRGGATLRNGDNGWRLTPG